MMLISFLRSKSASVIILLVVLAGCQPATPPQSILKSLNPPTDEEAQAFASQLCQAVAEGDVATIESLIDWDEILNSSLADFQLSSKNRKELSAAFLKGMNERGGFGGELVRNVSQGGSYQLLRVHDVDGQKRALCRMALDNQGINYHDFVLHKDDAGNVNAVDAHVALTGELLSETFRRILIPIVAQQNRGVMDRLAGKDEEFVKHAKDFQRMSAAAQTDPELALNIYNTLPKSLQQDKNILILRLQAAANTDADRYSEAFEAFRENYPNDPAIDLMSVDYFLIHSEWSKSLEAIDRVDESLGGDPYLDVQRASIYYAKGDFKKGKLFQQRATEAGFIPEDAEYSP